LIFGINVYMYVDISDCFCRHPNRDFGQTSSSLHNSGDSRQQHRTQVWHQRVKWPYMETKWGKTGQVDGWRREGVSSCHSRVLFNILCLNL